MRMSYYMSRLLLVFVCLFVLFSHLHTVYASEYDPDYYITNSECTFTSGIHVGNGAFDFDYDFIKDSIALAPGSQAGIVNQNIDRMINAGTYDIQITVSFSKLATPHYLHFDSIYLYCMNGDTYVSSGYNFSSYVYTDSTSTTNAYFVITYKDVVINSDFNKFYYFMNFTTAYTPPDGYCDIQLKFEKVLMMSDKDKELVEISKENLQVSNNIFDTVKNIFSSIANLPSSIANSVKGFFDNVVNAVTNLGNFIIEGIKNLFIPTEDDITAMQEKWNNLLSERFGALYQVIELISDYAKAFTNQSKKTITLPSITIPLGSNSFTFGGWEVAVVPDGFDIVFNALKLIISITCTIWFVNGLKNRFEKIVGGADDI